MKREKEMCVIHSLFLWFDLSWGSLSFHVTKGSADKRASSRFLFRLSIIQEDDGDNRGV